MLHRIADPLPRLSREATSRIKHPKAPQRIGFYSKESSWTQFTSLRIFAILQVAYSPEYTLKIDNASWKSVVSKCSSCPVVRSHASTNRPRLLARSGRQISDPSLREKYSATEVQMAGSNQCEKFADHMDIAQNPICVATHKHSTFLIYFATPLRAWFRSSQGGGLLATLSEPGFSTAYR